MPNRPFKDTLADKTSLIYKELSRHTEDKVYQHVTNKKIDDLITITSLISYLQPTYVLSLIHV